MFLTLHWLLLYSAITFRDQSPLRLGHATLHCINNLMFNLNPELFLRLDGWISFNSASSNDLHTQPAHAWFPLVVALSNSNSCSYTAFLLPEIWLYPKKQKMVFTIWILAFWLCNMFACIVEDTQIILYHIFIAVNRIWFKLYCLSWTKTLLNPELFLCAEVFLYESLQCWVIFSLKCWHSAKWALSEL